MLSLPDTTEHFATDAEPISFVVGKNPFGCAHDDRAVAVFESLDLFFALINAASRLGDPLDLVDNRAAFIVIFQNDVDAFFAVILDNFIAFDITFL